MNKKIIILLIILLLGAGLRLYKLTSAPVSLFGDEIDAGYNAYSLLKTGRDYNGNLFPIHFESMGDYRPFLFIWSLVPSIAVFGLNDFAVRLVPALWGVLGVLFIYLLVQEMFKEELLKVRGLIPLLAALLLAILPWHLHYSRAAFEVTLMLTLILSSLWALIKAVKGGSLRWLILAVFIFGLDSYSYNIAKLYSPFLLFGTAIIYRKLLLEKFSWQKLVLAGSIFGSLMLPLTYDSMLGSAQQRFGSLNILNTPDLVANINYQRGQINSWPVWVQRTFHNKANTVTAIFFDNYLHAFSPSFLFSVGQVENPRHSLPGQGLLYWWMAPFVLLGLFMAWQNRSQFSSQVLLVWLFTAPIPAAFTIDGGQHATRLFVMIPPLIILASLGISHMASTRKLSSIFIRRGDPLWSPNPGQSSQSNVAQQGTAPTELQPLFIFAGLSLVVVVGLINYLQNYFYHYIPTYHHWWNYGMEPALSLAKAHKSEYERVVITKGFVHLPMLYYLFYSQYPPALLHEQFALNRQGLAPDPTSQIGKYYFSSIPPGDTYTGPNALYIGLPEDENERWRKVGELPSTDPMDDKPVLVYLESL